MSFGKIRQQMRVHLKFGDIKKHNKFGCFCDKVLKKGQKDDKILQISYFTINDFKYMIKLKKNAMGEQRFFL